eukprot:7387168-Prymnesium_polylepis.3
MPHGAGGVARHGRTERDVRGRVTSKAKPRTCEGLTKPVKPRDWCSRRVWYVRAAFGRARDFKSLSDRVKLGRGAGFSSDFHQNFQSSEKTKVDPTFMTNPPKPPAPKPPIFQYLQGSGGRHGGTNNLPMFQYVYCQ